LGEKQILLNSLCLGDSFFSGAPLAFFLLVEVVAMKPLVPTPESMMNNAADPEMIMVKKSERKIRVVAF
jgi:hypothetical protein